MKFLTLFTIALLLNNSNAFEHDLIVTAVTYVLWLVIIFVIYREVKGGIQWKKKNVKVENI